MIKKDASSFGKNYMINNLISMIPGIIIFITLWIRLSPHGMDKINIVLTSLFLLNAIWGLWWQKKRESQFKCPECKKLLKSDQLKLNMGDPINFKCFDCNIFVFYLYFL